MSSNETRAHIVAMWAERMGNHADTALDALVYALCEHRDGKDIDIAARALEIGFDTTAAPAGWHEKAISTFEAILATLPTPVPGEG
ncbi:hypothetical protein DEU38_103169 [Rhodococcus sp. AG1013]|uniref:hypothetical protein n=1 Tax=Rhodococcus sp. AG1013 TaxID=2183996 RepID=UPI000E0C1863|nr:hypothetical protein [Rhodococcus sp. AG1013]RDI32436.1 hypothetical protein DEU38_103169 [Rhodococcus sp. AG1013]